MIYKTFTGKYIDIDRLIAIGEPYIFNKQGIGCMISFEMHFQLLESPINYELMFSGYVSEFYKDYEVVKTWMTGDTSQNDVVNKIGDSFLDPFKEKVNEIIKVWKEHKNEAL